MKNPIFHISNINIVESINDIDLANVPQQIKRKLSNMDKIALTLLLNSYNESIDEIVFTSNDGEFEKLKLIIDEFSEYNEVSPIRFSGSVHNYPVGCFNIIKKTDVFYTALCALNNSISMGLLKGILSDNFNVLFCYSDYINKHMGISCILSKKSLDNNSIKAQLIKNQTNCVNDEFIELKNFLTNNTSSFNCSLFQINRIN